MTLKPKTRWGSYLNEVQNHGPVKGTKRWIERHRMGMLLTLPNSHLMLNGWEPMTKYPQRKMPWLPYCMTRLLDDRLPTDARVTEYGGGYGSFWWAQRQAKGHVTVIERDAGWYAILQQSSEIQRALACVRHPYDKPTWPIDLAIIDSTDRLTDAYHAQNFISKRGIMIIDDTHRDHERRLAESLQRRFGYKALYLEGVGPWSQKTHGSTLLYHEDNILEI